jgi:hypothetical protein
VIANTGTGSIYAGAAADFCCRDEIGVPVMALKRAGVRHKRSFANGAGV